MTNKRNYQIKTVELKEIMKNQNEKMSYISPNSKEAQQKKLVELWQCNEILGLEIFYFLIDLTTLKLIEKKGLYKTLGYFDSDFTLDDYFEAIPLIQKDIFKAQWYCLFNGIKQSKPNDNLMKKHQEIALHGIKKQNGEFLYVKRISMPFEFNKAGDVTVYLCLFIVVGDYDGQVFQTRVNPQSSWEKQNGFNSSFSLPFTKKELKLLKAYAQNPSLTANALAEEWNVSYNTVLTHKNNAMSKARKILLLQFPNVRTLAQRLREMGLL